MWTLIKAAAGGAWSLLRAVPAGVYAALLVMGLLVYVHRADLAEARAQADAAARAELAPQLVAQQRAAADAQGQVLALDAGLQQCIGARYQFGLITSAVLTQREQQRATAIAVLTTTRQELANAYSQSADGCAGQPVPAVVVGVLDAAAFGPGQAHTYAVDYGPGAAAGAGAGFADSAHAGAGQAGAYTAYADLSAWIAEGWAPALQACNADKAAIAALRPQP